MAGFWKKARVTAAVGWHTVSPLSGPALQQAHLEPAMTPTEYARAVEREQDAQAADWQGLQHDRELERATTRPVDRDGGPDPDRERDNAASSLDREHGRAAPQGSVADRSDASSESSSPRHAQQARTRADHRGAPVDRSRARSSGR